jgi:predicted CXXCH cytochrome family protein
MKNVLAIMVLLLVASLAVYAQVQPNGPPQGSPTLQTQKGVQSLMYGGVHDFGITGVSTGNQNQSDGTCDYCHRPHIVGEDGQAAPLWARKSLDNTLTYGVYSSVSLDATVDPINADDNYSSFCLSCHDGSQMLATAAWGSNGHPYNFQQGSVTGGAPGNWWPPDWDGGLSPTTDPYAFTDAGGISTTGELMLSHTHPVNFDYADAVSKDGQLYGAAATGYVYLDGTTTPARAVGRLFGGKMQCSSCHNPHFKTGIGLQGSGNKGALCVSCHIK